MSSDYTFDVLDDEDGATRGGFLTRLLTGGGALLAGGGVLAEFAPTAGAASAKMDVTVLNAAAVLEAIGKTFYAEALRHGHLTGETKRFAQVVHEHEVLHAAFIKKALGRDAKPLPSVHFGDRTHSQHAFQRTAMRIEGICTTALVGVAPLVTRTLLSHAGTLLPVEAQHVAWISNIIGADPAPVPFNPKATLPQVKREITPYLGS